MKISDDVKLDGAYYVRRFHYNIITFGTNLDLQPLGDEEDDAVFISVDNIAVNCSVTLPDIDASSTNRIYMIKRIDSSSTGTITINCITPNSIESSTGVVASNTTLGTTIGTRRYTFQSNGTFWALIGVG
jgi:hypothetical protein